jgi:hypothetical protein
MGYLQRSAHRHFFATIEQALSASEGKASFPATVDRMS